MSFSIKGAREYSQFHKLQNTALGDFSLMESSHAILGQMFRFFGQILGGSNKQNRN